MEEIKQEVWGGRQDGRSGKASLIRRHLSREQESEWARCVVLKTEETEGVKALRLDMLREAKRPFSWAEWTKGGEPREVTWGPFINGLLCSWRTLALNLREKGSWRSNWIYLRIPLATTTRKYTTGAREGAERPFKGQLPNLFLEGGRDQLYPMLQVR